MVGRVERAALMADCTSLAAPSILRSRSNCRTTSEEPRLLEEVISVTPAMRPRARSSGVATVAAMVSGPAPGSFARTTTTGKSTCGSGATGSRPKATTPARAMARVSRVVATGRRIKGAERFRGRISGPRRWARPSSRFLRPLSGVAPRAVSFTVAPPGLPARLRRPLRPSGAGPRPGLAADGSDGQTKGRPRAW